MDQKSVVIPKTWRSEVFAFCLFLVVCIASLWLSKLFPGAFIFEGNIFTLAGRTVFLRLPLLWFAPAGAAFILLFRMYNVRFSVDERGIESRTGILGTQQVITRVRYEDVRSVETKQSLLDRLLNIGNVEVGTAATGDIEIVLDGVGAPLEVQEMIQNERDRRQALARKRKISSETGVLSEESQISSSE